MNRVLNRYERFFDEVIKPGLVRMAIDDTLPLDMTQIELFSFEKEIKEFEAEEEKRVMIEKARVFLCTDTDEEILEMIKLLEEAEDEDECQLASCVDGVSVWEPLEGSISVKDLLYEIRL